MVMTTQSNTSLIFTLAAALKVKSLIDEEGNPKLNLRVFITGGGCSGFQYGFTFDENINTDDMIIEKKFDENGQEIIEEDEEGGDAGGTTTGARICSVKLLVDAMSYQYLQGAEIDFRDSLKGSEFVIRNPQAKTTCGCGSSFSV